MLDLIQYIVFFLVTIAVLVAFHEFGHFVIARASGVHVLRFCIGFGKRVLTYKDRVGTEFSLAIVPLGGYVSMYDEREFENPDPRLARFAFNNLSPWWRIAIALGGPVANFILAFLVYWIIYVVGVFAVVPLVGPVAGDSPAYSAGLRGGEEIVAVDGKPTRMWSEVNFALVEHLGDTGTIEITTRRGGREQTHYFTVEDWHADDDMPDLLGSLGLAIGSYPAIGKTVPGDPAQQAGLREGDVVRAIDGVAIVEWQDFLEAVRTNPERDLVLTVDRPDGAHFITVTPGARPDARSNIEPNMQPNIEPNIQPNMQPNIRPGDASNAQPQAIGYIGAEVSRPRRTVEYSVLGGIGRGFRETVDKTVLTLQLLGKMVVGDLPMSNLSGPITIAKVAGDSARIGWMNFMALLALLSISLGIINLLPVPILDGGQVVFHVLELVRRKPLSLRAQMLGAKIGIIIVIGIMVLAFYNDIVRWF